MSVYEWIGIGLLCLTVATFPVIGYFLRKAARYNRITYKLRAGRPLTIKEQRLLDQVK